MTYYSGNDYQICELFFALIKNLLLSCKFYPNTRGEELNKCDISWASMVSCHDWNFIKKLNRQWYNSYHIVKIKLSCGLKKLVTWIVFACVLSAMSNGHGHADIVFSEFV